MNSRIPIQVLVYPVRRREVSWEYLLLRRTEERGGFWQGVTGAPEEGEDVVDAARRELLEETGYSPQLITQTGLSYTLDIAEVVDNVFSQDIREIPEYVFFTIIDTPEDPVIDLIEHTQWNWCSFDEALEILHWKTNKDALVYVHSMLEEL